MFTKISILVVVLISLFLVYVAFQPSDYSIAREITIHKPAEVIFPHINAPKLMNQWSPWAEMDPNLQMNYSGPEEGVGAKASWDSKGQMGTGSATISESIPNEVVRTELEYTKPFQMVQHAEISIKGSGAESVVRWSVKGQNTFMGRLMCTFMNMDKMVGGTFEKGLATLKSNLEKTP